MDTSEKINVFKSFEELTQEIIRDKESHDMLAQRYAVRFIMLNNFNEFKELAKFMANIGVQSLDLENLIDDGEDDTWITKDMLKNAIKACIVPTFVTPFSEVARFYDNERYAEFDSLVKTIRLINATEDAQQGAFKPAGSRCNQQCCRCRIRQPVGRSDDGASQSR